MEFTYQVWQSSWNGIAKHIDRLRKRAAKMGMDFVLTVGEWAPAIVRYDGPCSDTTGEGVMGRKAIYANRATVTLIGEAPKLPGGWALVGVIEVLEGNVLLRNVPGETIPVPYRDSSRSSLCEHCNAKRNRTATFVVRDDNGTHKQVGRQCLADFLGHVDPHALIAGAEFLLDLQACMESAGEWDEEGGGGRGKRLYYTKDVAAISAACVRLDGWCSRKNAELYDKRATAQSVTEIISPKPTQYQTQKEHEWLKAHESTEADKAEAETAVAWGRELPGVSDYEYNLSVVCRAEFIESRHVGILASLISAHQRHLGQQREVAAETSTFQGEIGKRAVYTLTVEHTQDFDSDYGLRVMNRLRDAQGNLFVWWSFGKRLEVGNTYTGKATVKSHEAYKGRKQTTLTRFSAKCVAGKVWDDATGSLVEIGQVVAA